MVGVERRSTATRCATSGAASPTRASSPRACPGSTDLYEADGRDPFASINFITAHDGFTLRDLVSYDEKHNEANREDNQDGTDDNRSWNCGVEGETDDPEVLALRARQQRNFLATLLLSQGTPMLLGGDEIGRTQHGNNNAWCQDNEISWFDWSGDGGEDAAARLHPAADPPAPASTGRSAASTFLRGQEVEGSGLPDVWWFRADGLQDDPPRLAGRRARARDVPERTRDRRPPVRAGEDVEDDSFVLLFNAELEDRVFTLPRRRFGAQWALELSTADPEAEPGRAGPWGADRAAGGGALDRDPQARRMN